MKNKDLTYNQLDMNNPPLFSTTIQAGFPSSADNAMEHPLDLNKLIIKNSAATFFVRVEGSSMEGANIRSGDILVVDRSLPPSHGKIVVAIINGEFTIKQLLMQGSVLSLAPENSDYPFLIVNSDLEFQVWGVVTYVIHKAL